MKLSGPVWEINGSQDQIDSPDEDTTFPSESSALPGVSLGIGGRRVEAEQTVDPRTGARGQLRDERLGRALEQLHQLRRFPYAAGALSVRVADR